MSADKTPEHSDKINTAKKNAIRQEADLKKSRLKNALKHNISRRKQAALSKKD